MRSRAAGLPRADSDTPTDGRTARRAAWETMPVQPRHGRRPGGAARQAAAGRAPVQGGGHQHEPAGHEPAVEHRAQEQQRADVVPADARARPARVAQEAGQHLREPFGRVGVARAVLGVPVQREVGQHEAVAVAQLLDQRLPLAVREAGGVDEGEGRAGPRLAVGDARSVGVVVEAELHPGPIVE